MINSQEIKKGTCIRMDGGIWKCIWFEHRKPGKGNTVMQMDLRDVKSGAVVHKTMRPTEKVDLVEVTKKNAQYLYSEGDTYTFMDTETYDQYEVSADQLGDDVKFLIPNTVVDMDFTDDNKIIGIELPATVELTVKETQPGIKGATVAGGGKPATMETGLVVNVPFFINEGDVLTINTSDGTYVSRANK